MAFSNARGGVTVSIYRLTHNWWHVALCYLEGHAPVRKVLEVYDQHIWKELEKADAVPPEVCYSAICSNFTLILCEVVLLLLCIQVYLNALGLLLRVYLRGELDIFEDRLKILASCITDQVSYMCFSVRTIEKVTSQSMSDVCLQFD